MVNTILLKQFGCLVIKALIVRHNTSGLEVIRPSRVRSHKFSCGAALEWLQVNVVRAEHDQDVLGARKTDSGETASEIRVTSITDGH